MRHAISTSWFFSFYLIYLYVFYNLNNGYYWTVHPPPPSSIHLHPPPPSSFQPPLSSIHHHPAVCNTLSNIWTKILYIIGQILDKFRPKYWKLFILTENQHTWYVGGVDSESKIGFLKFWLQNPFLGKFGP